MADSRFVFSDVNDSLKARRQLVSGTEVKYYKPRGDPTKFSEGDELDFQIAPGPFFVSNLNHLEVRITIRKRLKDAGQGSPGAWTYYEAEDEDKVEFVENLGSRLLEQVVYRNGEIIYLRLRTTLLLNINT